MENFHARDKFQAAQDNRIFEDSGSEDDIESQPKHVTCCREMKHLIPSHPSEHGISSQPKLFPESKPCTRSYTLSDMSYTGTERDTDDMEDVAQPFADDMYGMASACIIRDLHFMQKSGISRQNYLLRVARTINNVVLLFINIGLQMYLLRQVKVFVTAPAVQAIREDYDAYESAMYSKTYINDNGFHRGVGGVHSDRFDALDDDIKDVVCHFPLSQPTFFFVILYMWTIRVCQELRAQWKWLVCLILNTTASHSMEHCFQDDNGREWRPDGDYKERMVYRLPRWVKGLLLVFVGAPRIVVCCVLLWLGCRWLCATTSFAELILNAVGLEFVLSAKELLYNALVPYRTKTCVSKTKMMPLHLGVLSMDISAAFGSILWALAAALWAYLYMTYFQQVLPGYKWDIPPCDTFHTLLHRRSRGTR